MATRKKQQPSEKEKLLARLSRRLGISSDEVELRALHQLAASLPPETKPEPPAKASRGQGGLPQRLFLLLDGRGLDGRGLPIEIIDLPATVGSGRKNTIWINSPQIETRHLQITHGDNGWVLEDLGTEHGTFFGDKKVRRRVLQDGDEFRLAGYLRLRAELR